MDAQRNTPSGDDTAIGDRKSNVAFLCDFMAADSESRSLRDSVLAFRNPKKLEMVTANPNVITVSTVHQGTQSGVGLGNITSEVPFSIF